MLPLKYPVITLRLNSSSNSSWLLGLKLGTLLKNSHASLFLAWKRCFSSTRVLQNSRSRSNSAGLLFTSCCLIEASSVSVASTKSLSVSSNTEVWSWTRVCDRGRGAVKLPARWLTLAPWRGLCSPEACLLESRARPEEVDCTESCCWRGVNWL